MTGEDRQRNVLAFIGGTGPEGLGLAMRMAKAGNAVIIGSRSLERAQEAAGRLREQVPGAVVEGLENSDAAKRASIVFISVPFSGHRDTVQALAPFIGGKLVVDVAVPLEFQKGAAIVIPVEEGSAAEQAQSLLPEALVVSGFHHLDARELTRLDRPIDADVLICGDDAQAKSLVQTLAEEIEGVRALDGGALANSRHVEAFTAVLIGINRRYRAHTSIRIAGL